jgi:hypothetical protein
MQLTILTRCAVMATHQGPQRSNQLKRDLEGGGFISVEGKQVGHSLSSSLS